MRRQGVTINDAAHEWVREFNAIPQGMISELIRHDIDSWHEITALAEGDRVYHYQSGDYGSIILYDSETELYTVELDNGKTIQVEEDDIERERYDFLPMWGTMWSFGDSCDDWWLTEDDGIQVMSNCGFRIYEHDEWGYFFGIDGAGYDFYEAHWIPLYKARGLHWHDESAELEETK